MKSSMGCCRVSNSFHSSSGGWRLTTSGVRPCDPVFRADAKPAAQSAKFLEILVQLVECATQAVELVHKMKNDVDALVVDSETSFQIRDQARPREIHIREIHSAERLIRNEPPLLKPEVQRLPLEACTGQELLLVHDHDALSSRGSNVFPVPQFATKASSSGSGVFGKTTFNLTNWSP